jgi:alpha-N-arabinofuranosidase
MEQTRINVHSAFTVGEVDPRLFGGFLEHLGRAVYQGVFEPESVHADENGFRADVTGALDRLEMTTMRYPGGNFVSGYHWMHGVGPIEDRPSVRELAWHSIEPNHFGTDEFIQLCAKMMWTPMIAVNLGTGTPEDARDWVEYCNVATGTQYADYRAVNGSNEPFGVPLWCLGNEMDGPWQLGHTPARDYAIRAQQAARLMKRTDPSIELVVCGSCTVDLDTYLEWDREVLEYTWNDVDYVSLHRYVGNPEDDTASYLGVTNAIDRQIEEMDAVCRFVQGKLKSDKRVYSCFDEWNVWYKNRISNGQGRFAPHLLEEVYNLEDALVAAGFLQSFIRHADSVKIATIAQIVNVIAPILTRGDEMLIQSIFYPFEMISKRRHGSALQTTVVGPSYATKSYGDVTTIDASAILGRDRLHIFATNRSLTDEAEVVVDLSDGSVESVVGAELLTGTGPKAANSFEDPDQVTSKAYDEVEIRDGNAVVRLPALSFCAMTLDVALS